MEITSPTSSVVSKPAESPFSIPAFRSLWIAGVISNIGTGMHEIAAVWELARASSSPTVISLLQTAGSLPVFLFALPAGALADIMDRRRLLILTQCVGGLASLALAISAWRGAMEAWSLMVTAATLGTAFAFTVPTWQGAMAQILRREMMPAAVTWGSVSANAARVVGPILGGWMLVNAGPGWVFTVNALTFFALATVLWQWKVPAGPPNRLTEDILSAMLAALRFIRHSLPVQNVLTRVGMFGFAAIAPVVLLPILVRRDAAIGVERFGMILGAYGIGALTMALIGLPILRRRIAADHLVTGAVLVTAAAVLGMASFHYYVPLLFLMAVAGGAWFTGYVSCSVAMLTGVPMWARGRGAAMFLVVFQGCLAVGAFAWGQVAEFVSLDAAYLTASFALFAAALFGMRAPLACALAQQLEPTHHWHGHAFPEPDLDDGPVLVTVRYQVRAADAAEFQQAMYWLGLSRQRSGAFRWALWRSLDEPEIYYEVMVVRSWAEHLRQHERANRSDQQIEEAALRYHAGQEPPAVGHFIAADNISVPMVSHAEIVRLTQTVRPM